MMRFLDWLLGRNTAPEDRRRSPRYRALPNRALILWRDGGDTRSSRVRLLNLGGAGALLATQRRLPRRLAVWLRVEEPAPTGWIAATVASRAGARRVALEFVEPCPYDVFKAAIQEGHRPATPAPKFADGYWR